MGINLNQKIRGLFKDDIKSDGRVRKMNKWRNIICSMLGKLNIVKMTTFPKLLCRLNKILNLQILILALKHI